MIFRKLFWGKFSLNITDTNRPSFIVLCLQGSKTEQLEKNPTAFVNPEQPLIDKLEVLDDDINAQEQKVKDARNRLAAAIKALG